MAKYDKGHIDTDTLIEKEKHCPTLCVDCPNPCKEYKTWLEQYRKLQ